MKNKRNEIIDELYDGIENCLSATSVVKKINENIDVLSDNDVVKIIRYLVDNLNLI